MPPSDDFESPHSPRRTVRIVAGLNLAYFGVEFAVAVAIGSVSLFADSIDFLEDASVNILVLVALGWSAARRARVGMMTAALLLVPAAAAIWTAWDKISAPVAPAAALLTLTGLGALAVNWICAAMLSKYRHHAGGLVLAAFLSARNDVISNVAIILAGLFTAYTQSAWPDLIVGFGIAGINIGAAREVYLAAKGESDDETPWPTPAP